MANSILKVLSLVAGLFCISTKLSKGNIMFRNSKLSHHHLSDTSKDTGITNEIVHLLKCPGSSIKGSGLQNISSEFFRKYGLLDQLEQQRDNFSLTARFSEGNPDCTSDSILTSVQPSVVTNNYTDQGHAMLIHGWILKYHSDVYWESISPTKYCIVGLDDEDEFSIKYCHSDCKSQPCISKCCLANEVCDLGGSHNDCSCADSGKRKWTSTVEQSLETNYSFIHRLDIFSSCETVHFSLHQNSVNLNSSYQNNFKILQNGSVKFHRSIDGKWITFPEGTYCVDGAAGSHTPDGGFLNFSGESSDMIIQLCRSVNDIGPDELQKQQFLLFTVLVPIATVFILLTLIVYILTWQEQNMHGYTNFFYLVTLLAMYIFIVLGNVNVIGHPYKHSTSTISICTLLAWAIHFSYLSSACWVTCISYDVWRSFKKMNSVAIQSRGKRRFTTFCIFSFGYPLIQVSICAILDAVYRDKPAEEIAFVLPNYGRFVCNMSNDGLTYYLYVPITFLLMCNISFFVATIITMIHYKKSIREAFAETSNNVNPSKAHQSFGIYTRLFIIMGIFWISQIISWFVLLNMSNSDQNQSLKTIFAITDALTVLQAVAIFYIFSCKRSVFANLWTLHPWLRPFLLLWVKNGCCSIPSTESRKAQIVNSSLAMARILTLKDTRGPDENNEINRDSKGSISSSLAQPKTAITENDQELFARQTSLASDISGVTITSEMDDSFKAMDIGERENDGKMSETVL